MADFCCAAHAAAPLTTGSRRRRLWELGSHSHCPVIGVCVPLERVRVLARKLLVLQGDEDDYTLHCSLVTAAARRSADGETALRISAPSTCSDARSTMATRIEPGSSSWRASCTALTIALRNSGWPASSSRAAYTSLIRRTSGKATAATSHTAADAR